jgi:hypothetical protein
VIGVLFVRCRSGVPTRLVPSNSRHRYSAAISAPYSQFTIDQEMALPRAGQAVRTRKCATVTFASTKRDLGSSGSATREPGRRLFSGRRLGGRAPLPSRKAFRWSPPKDTAGPSKLWAAKSRGEAGIRRKFASVAVAIPVSVFGLSGLIATSASTVALASNADLVAAHQTGSNVVSIPSLPKRASGLANAPAGLRAAVRKDIGTGRLGITVRAVP